MIDFFAGAIVFSIIYGATTFGGLTLFGSKLIFAFLLSLVVAISYTLCIIWWATFALKCTVEELRRVKIELTRLNHLLLLSEEKEDRV